MSPQLLPPPEPALTLNGSAGLISSLEFIQSGCFAGNLFSGSSCAQLSLWDLPGTKRKRFQITCLPTAGKTTTVLRTIPSGKNYRHITVHLRSGHIQKWDLSEDAASKLIDVPCAADHGFCPAASIPLRGLLSIPASSNAVPPSENLSDPIALLNEADFEPVGIFTAPGKHGSPMKIIPWKEDFILVGYEDGTLVLWDVRNSSSPIIQQDSFSKLKSKERPSLLDMDMASTGTGIVGSSGNTLQRFKLESSEIQLIDSVKLKTEGVSCVKVRPDEKIFTVGTWDYSTRVFSWRTLKPLATLGLHTDVVQCAEYGTVDGKNCTILGGKDGLISVWSLY